MQQLIYSSVVPVNRVAHREKSIQKVKHLSFAKDVNSFPIVVAEFLRVSEEMPVVFIEAGDAVVPVALTGLAEKQNLLVTAEDKWDARYVPAFIRRYPFVFAEIEGGEELTVCVDEGYEGLNEEGRGERLFDSEGETTEYLARIIEFLQDYERQFSVTKAFCAQLKELDLLMDGTAQIDLGDAGKRTLGGIKVVNEAALNKLTDEQLLGMARSGQLRAVHAHLSSLSNINQLADRARERGLEGGDASVEQPEAAVSE
ncbi:MAG: SapC family protein [Porticoccaceae bacterium]|jgi:hypothetical protein|nr:SapC family protein [Porticoccaceae bacterium]